MHAPSFWWREPGTAAALLAPASALYGAVAAARLRQTGERAGVPVLCVGDPTVGGSGKTPTALALARLLIDAGERPFLLARGYGGKLAGPVRVDPAHHRAEDVGDEPLLLARCAPTIIARERVAGARVARAAGASVIVLDDGFQNPSLAKDLSILVIDGRRGIGNGLVFPAGPLRAPLAAQIDRAQAALLIGDGPAASVAADVEARGLAVFRGRLVPDAASLAALTGGRALAFAGIGDPEKFFATMTDAGVDVAIRRGFPDHHRFTAEDAAALLAEADQANLSLVTTEKDFVRLAHKRTLSALAARSRVLPVALAIEDEDRFRRFVLAAVAAARVC
ncbi:MAG TPA: tetraacyldisaccharide 4'-kinase [Xanthobacteraceae bacterium]|jgi:tetraacyldisaccharide 4'-kinase|nr:tetraacyldisaccharide 4'-kinase [Xanthobacteraceae bacterium]